MPFSGNVSLTPRGSRPSLPRYNQLCCWWLPGPPTATREQSLYLPPVSPSLSGWAGGQGGDAFNPRLPGAVRRQRASSALHGATSPCWAGVCPPRSAPAPEPAGGPGGGDCAAGRAKGIRTSSTLRSTLPLRLLVTSPQTRRTAGALHRCSLTQQEVLCQPVGKSGPAPGDAFRTPFSGPTQPSRPNPSPIPSSPSHRDSPLPTAPFPMPSRTPTQP